LCAANSFVRRQGIPHPFGYRLEGTDGGPVQCCRPLVRHYFRQKKLCFPVNKGGYIGVFTGAFYGVPRPELLFNDFRTFIDGDTVNLPVAVFRSLPLPQFRLSFAGNALSA
jgi:hypothetical protein